MVVLLTALTLLTASSCSRRARTSASGEVGDTIALHYARGIALVEHADYTEAIIYNPWQAGGVLSRYAIRRPLTHSAIFIASIAALVEELGCIDAISGVCEPEYIANRRLHAAIDEGRIIDLGSAMTPSRERLIDLGPDAILLSPFQNVGSYGNIEQLGIPIIPCADYMEGSALARAEWMRFYGRLFGCGERADSLFAAVEKRYLEIRRANESRLTDYQTNRLTDNSAATKQSLEHSSDSLKVGQSDSLKTETPEHLNRRTKQEQSQTCLSSALQGGGRAKVNSPKASVFFDGRSGSAWYMPGGHSTLGQMVADAGGHYAFADNEQSGSVPFSFEQVFDRCRDADIWLYRYNAPRRMTLSLLRSEYEPYSRFKAFREGRVFGCNNAELIFFEEYPYHPDRLLTDFVHIFSGQTDSLRYFHRMGN